MARNGVSLLLALPVVCIYVDLHYQKKLSLCLVTYLSVPFMISLLLTRGLLFTSFFVEFFPPP